MNRKCVPLLFIVLTPICLFGFFREPDLIDATLTMVSERQNVIRPLFEQIYNQHGKNYPQDMLGKTDLLQHFTPSYTLSDDDFIEYASGKIDESLKKLPKDPEASTLASAVTSYKTTLLDAWQKGSLQDPNVAEAQKKYQAALPGYEGILDKNIQGEKNILKQDEERISEIDGKIAAQEKKQKDFKDKGFDISAGIKKNIGQFNKNIAIHQASIKKIKESISAYNANKSISQTISTYLSDIETIVKGVPALDPLEKLKIVLVDGGISQFYLIIKNEPIGLSNKSVKTLCYQLRDLKDFSDAKLFGEFLTAAKKAFNDALAQAPAANLTNYIHLKNFSSIIMKNLASLHLFQQEASSMRKQPNTVTPAQLASAALLQQNRWFFTGLFKPLTKDPNFENISQTLLLSCCSDLNFWAVKALLDLKTDPNTPLTAKKKPFLNPLSALLCNAAPLTKPSVSVSDIYAPEFREKNALDILKALLEKEANPTNATITNIDELGKFATIVMSKNLVEFAKLFIQAMLIYEANSQTPKDNATKKETLTNIVTLLNYATKLGFVNEWATQYTPQRIFNETYPYGNTSIKDKTILDVAAAQGRLDLLNEIKKIADTFTKSSGRLVSSATAEKAAAAAKEANQKDCEKMLNKWVADLAK